MYQYKATIESFCENELSQYTNFDLDNMKVIFSSWIQNKDKHTVDGKFENELFGLFYAHKLYESSVDCFLNILDDVCGKVDIMQDHIRKCKTVYCFGCGPGPEIAAFVEFWHRQVPSPRHGIKIVAVDQEAYWGRYIDSVASLDDHVELRFEEGQLSTEYLRFLRPADVCLMQYVSGMNMMEDRSLWDLLGRQFRMVLVLDQGKRQLHECVSSYGYNLLQCWVRGSQRFYFYHLNELDDDNNEEEEPLEDLLQTTENHYTDFVARLDRITSLSLSTNRQQATPVSVVTEQEPIGVSRRRNEIVSTGKCPRGLHLLRDQENLCKAEVQYKFKCGHFVTQCCHKQTKPTRCHGTMRNNCHNSIHGDLVDCNGRPADTPSANIGCSSIVPVRLLCGHRTSLHCRQLHLLPPLLQHRRTSKAGDDPPFLQTDFQESTQILCGDFCNQSLACGHTCSQPCNSCFCGRLHPPCGNKATLTTVVKDQQWVLETEKALESNLRRLENVPGPMSDLVHHLCEQMKTLTHLYGCHGDQCYGKVAFSAELDRLQLAVELTEPDESNPTQSPSIFQLMYNSNRTL